MTYYKSWRIIDRKPRWIIVDDNGNITNKNPTKEELKNSATEKYVGNNVKYTDDELLEYLKQFYEENGRIPTQIDFANNHDHPHYTTYHIRFGSWNRSLDIAGLWEKRYNSTHTCNRCGRNFDEMEGSKYPLKEYDKERNFIGWTCRNCYQKYDPNSINNIKKSVSNCRTGNQDQNHSNTKGDKDIELACRLYRYENLNEKYDNHITPIDCLDPRTGLFHQVQGRFYNGKHGWWQFSHLDREWYKEYEDMICFCKSKDGKRIERIYRFPLSVIKEVKTISIYRNPSRGGWYEKYRIADEYELKNANTLKHIIN